jgi:hypothetical protein
MDVSWFSYMNGFWVFPLLCFVFMALMMIMCGGSMWFRFGHRTRSGSGGETARGALRDQKRDTAARTAGELADNGANGTAPPSNEFSRSVARLGP